jgi:glycosyltransferase involved in cell wall biosynthesis
MIAQLQTDVSRTRRDQWQVSLIGWGAPSNRKTFSGFASQLAKHLERSGHLRRQYDCKSLTVTDTLAGALTLRPILSGAKPRVSLEWLWSPPAIAHLSDRLNRRIAASGDLGPFLEVGTLMRVEGRLGGHYQITDMTIAQARRAGRFGFQNMSPFAVRRAEEVQRESLERARHIFAMSRWSAESLVADCGVPENRITVIYTGPNLEPPPDAVATRRLRRILFIGYDWDRKGGPSLLQAFRIVRRAMPDATLQIVGPDPGIREPGVVIEGPLDRSIPAQLRKLATCYREATCLCLPSSFDPFPIAVIDAMSFGTPVVAFDTGSRREAVVDGATGRLVRMGDVAALAEALIDILGQPDLQRKMSAASFDRYATTFTWDHVIERIGKVISAHGGL